MLFKMMFIGYLYGIRSERQLEQEIQLNEAYRWFVGLGLTDRVPDHSTLSLNRKRLQDSDVVQEISDYIVFKATELRMVAGRVLITDSTHLKTNANKRKFVKQEVEKSVRTYLDDLDEAVEKSFKAPEGGDPDQGDESEHNGSRQRVYDARRQAGRFFYLDHRTVDHKYNIITDVHITPGNVHDSKPYLERLELQIKKFGFDKTLEGCRP